MTPANFDFLAALLKTRSGLVIGRDKDYLLNARLTPIAQTEKLADLDALATRLRQPGAEAIAARVVEAMTTNESLFFRDGRPFEHLRLQAFPKLCAARPPGGTIRVWSAASSSGQEAYSIAMMLADNPALAQGRRIEIIGTDIARDQLSRAREGIYTQFEVQRGLPVQMLVKYFQRVGQNWLLSEKIRNMVQFREWNLLADLSGLGRFDIVFCRNVLIYFDYQTKSRTLAAIRKIMPDDGVLYLGAAETVVGVSDRFAPETGGRGVYIPVGGAPAPAAANAVPPAAATVPAAAKGAAKPPNYGRMPVRA